MQKNNQKASILIWAIFMSLIISITFIQISTKINKNLQNNINSNNQLKINSSIKNTINSWSINWIYTNITLENWDKIIFNDSNNVTLSLKKWDNNISKINTDSTVTINIIKWWPIKYENNSISWIITNNDSISTTIWDLIIYNLWWYTSLEISSDEDTNFLNQYVTYKVTRTIWNKEIIKTKWKIKKF